MCLLELYICASYPTALAEVCKVDTPSDGGSGCCCPGGGAAWLGRVGNVQKGSDAVMKYTQTL